MRFGLGAALHALAPRQVSVLAFCSANVVIDVDSLCNLVHPDIQPLWMGARRLWSSRSR